jgi:hypothetical protein
VPIRRPPHVAQRRRHIDRGNSHRRAELDDTPRLAASGAHVEKAPKRRGDAEEIVGVTAIEPRQIAGLSLDNLPHRLFDIGHLAREGLHQWRIGRFRFLMKAFQNF